MNLNENFVATSSKYISGIMNLLWVAFITFFVLVEKISTRIKWIPYVAGLVLMAYGILLLR